MLGGDLLVSVDRLEIDMLVVVALIDSLGVFILRSVDPMLVVSVVVVVVLL